ncbi:hypothetical protein GCM10020221_26290 [Streptomyces thioluteus]|uniref:Uncharacterized protein n=1 Tax=Streptomyces thioluteus TaxID=66431 RepID=A0ABN3WVC7_STRTU
MPGRLMRRPVLARAATGALAGHDDALDEELAAPDAPRLATVLGAGEAGLAQRAGLAERLGVLHVRRRLGEEDLRVVAAARDRGAQVLDRVVEVGERGQGGQGVLRGDGRGDQVGGY